MRLNDDYLLPACVGKGDVNTLVVPTVPRGRFQSVILINVVKVDRIPSRKSFASSYFSTLRKLVNGLDDVFDFVGHICYPI